MDKINIIQLNPSRWEEYKNLRLRALQDNPESFGEKYEHLIPRSDEEWKLRLDKAILGKGMWMSFADQDGKLVGMVSGVSMESIKGGVKVREVFVVKEVRGQGIASIPMKNLIQMILNTSDRKVLFLGVFKSQEEAVKLYKSLGFEVMEEKIENFPNGDSHLSLIMQKVL